MKHIASLILLATLLLANKSYAQQTQTLTADKHNEYGLVYKLPITTIRFDVTARQTVSHAGPFYQYAKKYIGTDNVIKENDENWQIVNVKATIYGEADESQEYLMQFKPGALTSICIDENGMLLAINKDVDAPARETRPQDTSFSSEIGVKDFMQYVNEDFLASKSSAKQAQFLAESLMEVRDAKVSLTRGTAESMPTDGKQLDLMLNSLTHQEAAITAAFTGATESRTVTRTYTFTPEKDGKQVLFRMSDFAGFVDADDYSGEPVYINVKVTRQESLPTDEKGEVKKLPKDAVIYNLPGAAKVTLSLGSQTLWTQSVECSQFGVQFGLQPSLFSDKKVRSYATFDPSTGALTKIAEVDDK